MPTTRFIVADAPPPPPPDLDDFVQQFHGITGEAAELLTDITESQFHWSPDPESWSIGACLHHLTMVNAHVLPLIDRMIETASANMWEGDGTYTPGWVGKWMLKRLEPPVERCYRSPTNVIPPSQAPLAEVCKHFFDDQELYIERLERCRGWSLTKPKARSPFFKLIRMNLGDWIAVSAAHERRHLWQARELTLHEEFPPPEAE
jgi:hypothetical protein